MLWEPSKVSISIFRFQFSIVRRMQPSALRLIRSLRFIRFIIMANLWCDLFGLPAAFPIQKSSLLSLYLSVCFLSTFPLLFFHIFMAHSASAKRRTTQRMLHKRESKSESQAGRDPSLSLRQKTSSNGSSVLRRAGGRRAWQQQLEMDGNGIIKRSHQNDKIKKFKWQMAGKLLAGKRLEKRKSFEQIDSTPTRRMHCTKRGNWINWNWITVRWKLCNVNCNCGTTGNWGVYS